MTVSVFFVVYWRLVFHLMHRTGVETQQSDPSDLWPLLILKTVSHMSIIMFRNAWRFR